MLEVHQMAHLALLREQLKWSSTILTDIKYTKSELKGSSHVLRSVKQLERLLTALKEYRHTSVSWPVSTKHCPIDSAAVQKLVLKVERDFHAAMQIKNSTANFTIC